MNQNRLLLSLLLLAAGSASQAQEAKLKFATPAAPVAVVLDKLSKATGLNLKAMPSVAADVIFVNVHDVTSKELMERIAKTLNAEWRTKDDRQELYRGPNLDAQDRKRELDARVAVLQKVIEKKTVALREAGAWTSDTARLLKEEREKIQAAVQKAVQQSSESGNSNIAVQVPKASILQPDQRLLAGIFGRLSLQDIRSIAEGGRVVFSTAPTRVQLPMPKGADAVLNEYLRELSMLTPKSNAGANDIPKEVYRNFPSGDPSLGPGTCLLIANHTPANSAVFVQVLVTDRDNRAISSTQEVLMAEAAPAEKAGPDAPGEKPIQLSPMSAALEKVLPIPPSGKSGINMMFMLPTAKGPEFLSLKGSDASPSPTLEAELKQFILNPETNEPLSLAPTDALNAIANQLGKNVIAYLPDRMFVKTERMLAQGKTTPSRFLTEAVESLELSVGSDGDWVSMAPVGPASARDQRINRSALGKILRALDSQEYLTLDQLTAFAIGQAKAPSGLDFDLLYATLINKLAAGRQVSGSDTPGPWQMLQFYGSLSDAHRRDFVEGKQMSFQQLSAAQRALLSDMVYNGPDGPAVADPDGGPAQVPMPMGWGNFDLRKERTIAIPDGVLASGLLRMNLTKKIGVLAGRSNGGGSSVYAPSMLAWDKYASENASTLPDLAFAAPQYLDKFRPATITDYVFVFEFEPTVSLSRQMQDCTVDPNTPYGSYEALPKEVRDEVDAIMEALRNNIKSILGMFPQRGGRTGSPPPAVNGIRGDAHKH